MKKLLYVCLIASACLILLIFLPKKIISGKETIVINNIIYLNNDVSQKVKPQDLAMILKKYTSINSYRDYFPYKEKDIILELNIVDDGKPVHILLGGINICYESKNMGAHRILNSEQLLLEIEHYINR